MGISLRGMSKLRKKAIKIKNDLAMRVSLVTVVINLILAAGKIAAGIIGGSGAMISDGVHSASDVFTTIIVIIGIAVSRKKADSSHQYGHERLECVASILLAATLFATGIGIAYTATGNIFSGNYATLTVPTLLPLLAAIVSIVVKEWMYWYTRGAAKILSSGALMADAWHHRSDALSSVGSFIGILGARLGYPVLDSVASFVICIFIVKAAYDIFRDSIAKLTDRACDGETEAEIRKLIMEQEGVIELDDLKTRLFGSRIYIDVEISADGSQSLSQAHEIAEKVHDAIEGAFHNVKHCMVHVNPADGSEEAN